MTASTTSAPISVTVAEAARYLGFSETTVRRALQRGWLAGERTPRGFRIQRAVLEDFARSLAISSALA